MKKSGRNFIRSDPYPVFFLNVGTGSGFSRGLVPDPVSLEVRIRIRSMLRRIRTFCYKLSLSSLFFFYHFPTIHNFTCQKWFIFVYSSQKNRQTNKCIRGKGGCEQGFLFALFFGAKLLYESVCFSLTHGRFQPFKCQSYVIFFCFSYCLFSSYL